MPRRSTFFPLALPTGEEKPGYRWLYNALRAEILEGRLRPGARLPATRDLATEYGLARGTIVNAFDELKAEGYVETSIGSGTFVSKVLPDDLLQVKKQRGGLTGGREKNADRLSDYGRRLTAFPNYAIRASRAFRSNVPALDLFPTTLWARIATRRLRSVSTKLLLGCDPMGYGPLRQAVADYLSTSRGVKCTAEQVAILSGVQEALDIAARLLLNPGDQVALENPGYIGASRVFEAFGVKINPVPLDGEGMQVSEERLRGARLVYITPSHQFPLGVTMSLPRRLALLEWARKSGAFLFEDDYDSEYRYAGRPIPALQGLDRHGSVLFAGTFSKVLFPSLRLGYLVATPELVERVSAAKSVTSRHAALLDQAILCDFILEGHLARHLRRMRQVYAERLGALLEGARQRLHGLLEISEVEAGLQTVGWLCNGIREESAVKAAARRGVEVVSLGGFHHGPKGRSGLQIGFGAVGAAEIRRGVRELAIALEGEVR